MTGGSDLAYWLDVTADLLQRPLIEFPAADLAAHLNRSFALSSLSWEWRETENDFGRVQFVSAGSVSAPRKGLLHENLVSYRCEQQLSIPYWLQGVSHGAFVLTRANDAFTADERDLARRLQRLFASLYVQVRARGDAERQGPSGSVAQAGLTGTEIAVLSLLEQGYTAHRIARRLSNSPRTVHKHLEHIYRKLGVADRLMAVRAAAELGLVQTRDVRADDDGGRVAVLGHGGPHPA